MKSWVPTFSLGFAAFIFVTSEFLPVGLLREIASDFGRSEAATGMVMTIYAWGVALLSIPLTALSTRYNRRPLLLSLIAIFIAAHVLTTFAWSFWAFVGARLCVAFAHAVFWAIAIPFGIRAAPPGRRELAMSVVATGATLGSVLGIPIGTLLGQMFGWRMGFAAVGLGAAMIGLILYQTLPSAPGLSGGGFKSVMRVLRRRDILYVYLLTVVSMTGHYTAFNFISPFLQEVGLFPKELVAGILLLFGSAGLIGSFVAPRFLRRHLKASGLVSLAAVGLCLLSLRWALHAQSRIFIAVSIWGAMFILFNLVLQSFVLKLAPDDEDIAMAGFSGIYNTGIGAGAFLGSIFSVHELPSIGIVGAAITGVAFLLLCFIQNETQHEVVDGQ